MAIRWFAAFLFLICTGLVPAEAQAPAAAPTMHVQVAPLPPPGVAHFDPQRAVDAYLARIAPKDKARSDAYFEGGYVLQVVDVVYALAVAGLLLWLGFSSGMRNLAVRLSQKGFGRVMAYAVLLLPLAGILASLCVVIHAPLTAASIATLLILVFMVLSKRLREAMKRFAASRFMQTPIYVVQYVVVTTVMTLPLTIYEGFVREHNYGLSNQTFLEWAGDFGKGFLVSLFAFTVLLTVIYAVARRVKRNWWVWATGITVVFMMIIIMISPVYIAPLFNKYTPLPDSAMKSAILSMAHSNGIPADNVYTFDASKQSKRISANVSGLFGTTRISLNDNLLNRCTPSEVLAVMGHEMGHYVMNHVAILVTWFGLIALVGFWFVDRTFHGLLRIFGIRWGVESLGDPASLPLVMALLSVFFFLATPITNTISRTEEIQADLFGLNLARLPDAEATVDLKLVEYRKLDPTPIEEFIWFDHPSGRTRIWTAMRWKAEHLNDPDIMAGPISPQ